MEWLEMTSIFVWTQGSLRMLKVNAKNFSEAIELMEGLPHKLTKKDSPYNKKYYLIMKPLIFSS
jgi:hypothetical protein